MRRIEPEDVIVLCGLVLVVVGLHEMWSPLAPLVAGLAVIAFGLGLGGKKAS